MKIAQIAPISERVPPQKYGGTERVVFTLTEELIRLGHEVVLFASGDSQSSAPVRSIYEKNLREAGYKDVYGCNVWTLTHVGVAYSQAHEFDIIHDHNSYLSLPLAQVCATPTIFTLHGPMSAPFVHMCEHLRRPTLVTISEAQRSLAPHLNIVRTIHHGLYMEKYPFSDTSEGYLLFVGRITEEKGVHFAIEVALNLDLPLIIAAKLNTKENSPSDIVYFEQYVQPHLSEKIQWIGEVDEEKRNKLMSKALCLLHPATWNEPFGLTLIEAGACGCPVVAFGKGSIPEIIVHEKTGFIVDDVMQMMESVKKISEIQRSECRKYVLDTFRPQKMAEEYVEVYKKILKL